MSQSVGYGPSIPPDASTSVKGVTKLSAAPVSSTNPIAAGDNDPRLPTTNQKAALAGTNGTPASGNPYVTSTDPRLGGGTSSTPVVIFSPVDIFPVAGSATLQPGDFTTGCFFYIYKPGGVITGIRFYWAGGAGPYTVKATLWLQPTAAIIAQASATFTTSGVKVISFGSPVTLSSAQLMQTLGASVYETGATKYTSVNRTAFANMPLISKEGGPYFTYLSPTGSGAPFAAYHAGDAMPATIAPVECYPVEPVFQ